jgi:hypothetical protein
VGSRGYEVGLWPNIKFDIIRAQAASPVSASPADLWQEQINVGREKRRSATSGSAAPALIEAKPLPHLWQRNSRRLINTPEARVGHFYDCQADCPPQKESTVLPTRSFVSSARRPPLETRSPPCMAIPFCHFRRSADDFDFTNALRPAGAKNRVIYVSKRIWSVQRLVLAQRGCRIENHFVAVRMSAIGP